MKRLQLLMISFGLITIISCKGGDIIDTIIRVNVVNSLGQDLLNSPRTFDKTNVKFTSISNPETKLQASVWEDVKANTLAIYSTNDVGTNSNTAVLRLGTTKPDTIRCEFFRNKGYFTCTKVWLNGKLTFDRGNNKYSGGGTREITLVK